MYLQSAESIAETVLAKHWNPSDIKVDPFAIATAMGARVQALDPFNVDDMQLSGLYQPAHGLRPAHIYFNSYEAPVRQRFTVAHELGHMALGHATAKRDTRGTFGIDQSPDEVAANRFAAALLMPARSIDTLIVDRKIRDVAVLAKALSVSETAMRFRLRNLGFNV